MMNDALPLDSQFIYTLDFIFPCRAKKRGMNERLKAEQLSFIGQIDKVAAEKWKGIANASRPIDKAAKRT